MLATQLLDVVFIGTYTLGIEKMSVVQGTSGGYGNTTFNIEYTHSLVGALVISLVALIVTWVFWGRRNAIVIGVVVFSHWLLDIIVHRGDMAIYPGGGGSLGFGLWQWPWVVAAIELGMCLAGAYLYYHASARAAIMADRKREKAGEKALGYRQNATQAALVLALALVLTLVGDYFIG